MGPTVSQRHWRRVPGPNPRAEGLFVTRRCHTQLWRRAAGRCEGNALSLRGFKRARTVPKRSPVRWLLGRFSDLAASVPKRSAARLLGRFPQSWLLFSVSAVPKRSIQPSWLSCLCVASIPPAAPPLRVRRCDIQTNASPGLPDGPGLVVVVFVWLVPKRSARPGGCLILSTGMALM